MIVRIFHDGILTGEREWTEARKSEQTRMMRLRNEIFFSLLHGHMFHKKTRIFQGCSIFLYDAMRFSSKSLHKLFWRHRINLELLKIRTTRGKKILEYAVSALHHVCVSHIAYNFMLL